MRAVAEGSARRVFARGRRARRERYDAERNAAAVTRYSVRQAGDWVHVTATVNVAGCWLHWFIDGRWHGRSRRTTRPVYCPPGRTVDIRVRACRYQDVDWRLLRGPLPQGLRTIEWQASADAGTGDYLVQASDDGGATWSDQAVIRHDGRWRYLHTVGPLADDTVWTVRVVPRLVTGETGTAITVLSERVVRPPDPMALTAAFDAGTGLVTVDEA